MQRSGATKPTPLPVQALDHATGYLMAAAAIRALRVRLEQQKVVQAKLSLARTALLLATSARDQRLASGNREIEALATTDLSPWIEQSSWGPARRLSFPSNINTIAPHWQRPATELRSSNAAWLTK